MRPSRHSAQTAAAVLFLAIPIATTGAAEPGAEAPPRRIGIIGLDTSHAVAFTKALNVPDDPGHVPGGRVVAAYAQGSRDIASSVKRVPEYTAAVRGLGVEIVDTIPALLERVDAVLLETNDGRPHLEQALPVLQAGRPVFIDKPVAASLADAIAIYRLARQLGTPVFSASALRFSAATRAVRDGSIGDVLGCDACSPCSLEPTHPDLAWYGIHGCETLFTAMGPGCESVTRTHSADFDLVTGLWKDGRIGTFRGIRRGKAPFGGTAFGTKGAAAVGSFDGYKPLVAAIVEFLRTGRPPVDPAETLEIYAFIEAADESTRRDGGRVALRDVMERAEREADARIRGLGLDGPGPKPDAPRPPASQPAGQATGSS